MSDSTNTERPGYTPSEKTVWNKLNEVFANAQNAESLLLLLQAMFIAFVRF